MLLDSTTKIPDLLVRDLQHLVCLAIAAIPVGFAWQVTRYKYIEVDRHGLLHGLSDVFLGSASQECANYREVQLG